MHERPEAAPGGTDKPGDLAVADAAPARVAMGPLHRLAQTTAITALLLAIIVVIDVLDHVAADGGDRLFAAAVAVLAGLNLVAALLLRRAAIDHAGRAVASSSRHYRDAIENLSEGILMFDAGRVVSGWNGRLLELMPHLRPLLCVGVRSRDLAVASVKAAHPEWSEAQQAAWVDGREASLLKSDYGAELKLEDGRTVEVRHRRTNDGGIVAIYRDISRERDAVDALAASEARFRNAVDSMGEGLTLWDRDGRLLLWNERLLDLLPHLVGRLKVGVTIDEVNAEAVRRMHPDWSADQVDSLVAARLEARMRATAPFVVEMPSGRVVEISDYRTAEGGLVSVYRDITGARRAAEALSRTETRFRNAIDALGEGFALWDAEDRLVAWNERFVDINRPFADAFREGVTFEATLRDLAQRNAAWMPVEGQEAWIAKRLEKRRLGGRSELRFDGGVVIEITDHRPAGGGVVSIYRDVSEERRALDLLRRSEARFRDGIQSMADGFVMWDAEDRLVTWNQRHLEMLPYLRRHLQVGRPRREIVVAAVADGMSHLSEAARDAWVAERIASFRQYDRVFIMRPAGGRVIEVIERRTTEGGSVVLYRDVTEREQQTNDLRRALTAEREANQQQRRFIAIASHEFRTPLTVIDGSAQRLLAYLENAAPDVVKRLQRIRATVLRMTQLIDRTLTSARLDDGRMELRPERFDLAALLREACARQRSISGEFALMLDAPPSAEIVGDPRLVELVLTNLLSNAVKYSGASRTIDVELNVAGADVTISVCDHGVGIPESDLPRLFQRYFRASTAAGIPGTGIGLHLVRELVAMHGGTVVVESALGVGSTFRVTLPRVTSRAVLEARRARASS